MSGVDDGVQIGLFIGVTITTVILVFFRTCDFNITNEKNFKLLDATYKCQKTNELKEDP